MDLLERQLAETLAEIEKAEARLTELQAIRSVLRQHQPTPKEPAPRKPRVRVSDERARDFAVARQSFTTADYMAEFDVTRTAALSKLAALKRRGIIERRGRATDRNAHWLYVPIEGEVTSRRREKPPEANAATEAAVRGEVVAHTRARGSSGKPGTDKKRSARGVRIKRERQGT